MGYDLQLFSRLPASLDLDLAAPRGGILLVLREPIPETPDFHLGAQDAPPQELRVGGLAASIGMLGDWVGATGLQGPLQAAAQGTATFVGQQGVGGSVAESVPTSVAPAITGEWDANTWRGPGVQPAALHGSGHRVGTDAGIALVWYYAAGLRPITREQWHDGTRASSVVRSHNVYLDRLPSGRDVVWIDATRASTASWVPYVRTYRQHTARQSVWVDALPVRRLWASPWVRLWPRHRDFWHPHEQATPVPARWILPFAHGHKFSELAAKYRARWEQCMRPPFVWPPPVPPEPPVEPPFVPDLDLVLECRLPVPLWSPVAFDLWIDTCDRVTNPNIVPVAGRRVIIVVHSLQITTLPDGTPIPCDAISLRADRDSWCWGWEASVLKAASELAEQQREVQITVDGNIWTGLVETSRMSRRHGWSATQVGGRSRSAILAAPYTDARSRLEALDRTAVQLAEDELYNTGWVLDWRTVDWLIPSGVFAYDALTPIEAVVRIASAIGAIVQTHPSDPTISVIPRYGVSTWDVAGAGPDWIIPGDIILDMTVAWRPEVLYRGVWVSGQGSGVLVRVYRTGTDGAPYKQMVVDPLITHIDAARERGRQILCAGGKRADVTLTLPLSAEIGLIKPGQLVEVLDPAFRGYVDAVSINARRVDVIQTVTIERVDQTP